MNRLHSRCLTPWKGLTLIELLVSIVILSVGAIFVLRAYAKTAHALMIAEDRFNSYVFSVSKMAEKEMALREGLDVETGEEGTFQVEGQRFDWDIAVEPLSEEQLNLMTLTVVWRRAGHTFEDHIQTLFKPPEVDE